VFRGGEKGEGRGGEGRGGEGRGRAGPGREGMVLETRGGKKVGACAVVFASGLPRGLGFRFAGFRFKGLGSRVCFRLARPRARDGAKGAW
jgi:hypothetical protein